jgi:transposase
MVKALDLALSTAQEQELTQLRERHPKPYVRERASAILKVACGQSVRAVALFGLLRPRHPETVSEWIKRYLAQGREALLVQEGRGRKPAFSPSVSVQPTASLSSSQE